MKTLIVYHSYTGQTKIIAEKIQKELNCDILELRPRIPFSTDYQAVVDEYQNNETVKKEVEIADINIDITKYDQIIIGSPVWWYTITPVVRSFLKKYDLKGKIIYPFVTNAGWLGRSFKEIATICKGTIKEGLNIVFSEDYHEKKYLTPESEIENWITKIKSN